MKHHCLPRGVQNAEPKSEQRADTRAGNLQRQTRKVLADEKRAKNICRYKATAYQELGETDKLTSTAPIDSAEASKVLAKYIAEVVEKGLDNVVDNGGDINSQVTLANRIISTIISETKESFFDEMSVAERAEQLLALFDKKNNIFALNEKAKITRPETSIAQSSLFTGAIHEPQMFTELKKEIVSCNRIDMLVSFIKWSGLRLIFEELETFTKNGGELRIITTSYMGATDVKAI